MIRKEKSSNLQRQKGHNTCTIMTNKKIILVAISGCSSSGKTTIAKFTSQVFPQSILIHEDDFYKHDEEVPIDPKYGIRNWDSPEALDISLFEKELDTIKRTGSISSELIHNNNVDDISKFDMKDDFLDQMKRKYAFMHPDVKLVIVDGFMIYNNPTLSSKFDLKILIRAPYDVLKKRRAARPGYQTLDSFWLDPPYYFDEFVYKSYRKAHSHLFMLGDVEGELDSSSANGIKEFRNDENTPIEECVRWTCNEISKFVLCHTS